MPIGVDPFFILHSSFVILSFMNPPLNALRLALDPAEILRAQNMVPDAWQREFLLCDDQSIMLLCSRGAGKSRVTSAKALHRALFFPGSLILLVSRSQRQSMELFRYVKQGYAAVREPVRAIRETMTELELANGSRIVCLPGKEETVRSYQGVALLIKDEAARIPDDLNATVTPMLAVSRGQEIDLSTPWGQRGWFWKRWVNEANVRRRFKVTWRECPRHTAAFIERERREHGNSWVAQEYECSFESLTGLVYANFADQCATDEPAPIGRLVGGIDFGFRNPFAALWGVLTYDDVLWIDGERYLREVTLNDHAKALGKHVTWYADPAGAQEIASLRRAGFTVKRALNAIRPGISAVQARLETGRLKVVRSRCPNLLSEAQLYRWGDTNHKEEPVDEDNHALGALRYLIATLDRAFITRQQRKGERSGVSRPSSSDDDSIVPPAIAKRSLWPDLDNPDLWVPLN